MCGDKTNTSCSIRAPKRTKACLGVVLFLLLVCRSWVPVLGQGNEPQASPVSENSEDLAQQVKELRQLVQQLQVQVALLQSRVVANSDDAPKVAAELKSEEAALLRPAASMNPQVPPAQQATTTQPASQQSTANKALDVLQGTTVNFAVDGYYEYNFNAPIGRDSLLRAYDVINNAFSLNQADVILENAPDTSTGKRYGARIDLQFGQATETLQGNPANEPRPDIYRNIFQAYGTYVFPVSKGLTIDFGKWASSLSAEGNYTKDQINYSRSYWFDFLPFYHMGVRANYKLMDRFAFNYWLTNGTNQTEPFNGYKDELFGFAVQPHKNVSWTFNYYLGQEHPDFQYVSNGPNLPTIQGLPFEPIPNPAKGKLHIFDSYATWNATSHLLLQLEGDYVIERLNTNSSPDHTDGGAGYVRYQLTPRFALAGRAEYLSDRGGLFTGVTQALKETTATAQFSVGNGFLIFPEWRRDFSNQPYFLTSTLGKLSKSQTTAGVGLVWWFGGKEGPW